MSDAMMTKVDAGVTAITVGLTIVTKADVPLILASAFWFMRGVLFLVDWFDKRKQRKQ